MTKTSTLFRRTLFVLTVIGCMSVASTAQSANARGERITGVFDVQATVKSCTTDTTISQFRALHKYELGGTLQVVPATNPALLSAHAGVWTYQGANTYRMTFKMWRFDSAGNNIGWIVVKSDVAISEDGTAYAGSGRAETFDSAGNLLGASCPVFTGTRL